MVARLAHRHYAAATTLSALATRRGLACMAALLILATSCSDASTATAPTAAPAITTTTRVTTTTTTAPVTITTTTAPVTTTTTRVTTTTTTAPVTTTTPPVEGALRRKDAPAEGSDDQFDTFGTPGPPGCMLAIDPTKVVEATIEIGQTLSICKASNSGLPDMEVEVSTPDGVSVAVPFYRLGWRFAALPGVPVGEYRVFAQQPTSGLDVLLAEARFDVVNPTEPEWTIAPGVGPPGSLFEVGVAGLAPNRTYSIFLYENGGPAPGDFIGIRWLYLTDLAVETDEAGQALLRLQTASNDPQNDYRLVFPEMRHDLTFELE